MKYFTLDWWNGVQEFENAKDPHSAYEKYFESVKADLPVSFRQLHAGSLLHDGDLVMLKYCGVDGLLDMKINNDDGKGNLREVLLNYCGVTLFESCSIQEKGLPGPLGYGDFGFDEVEILENCFEHRMIFSSGIEINIRFDDMKLSYHDHA